MSVQKDPLNVEKDEEVLGAEDEFDDGEVPETFSCKYCEFQTPNIDELDEHIITHEEAILGDNDDGESEGEASNDEPTTPAVSEEPAKVYSLSNELPVKRIKQQLPAFYEECANKPNKRVFVCPYCGYQSMKKMDMNRHLKEHSEPVELPVYACAECPYTTRRKCDMPKHLLTHCENGTVPMFKCSECPYATKRKGDLSKHMLCHSKPSMSVYACSECPYSSKRHGDLKKHLVCHENEACGAKSNILFNCTECGYTSKRLNDLHKHAVLHCDRMVKGVFKCIKCDYASAAGNPFAKHVLSHCKVREMPVSIFPKDNSMEEYIVLEEEELHLYQLDKDNIATVQVMEKNVTAPKIDRKRKIPNEDQRGISKKPNLKTYYVEAKNDLQANEAEDAGEEAENSKVVVLPGYSEEERNVES